MAIVVNEGGKTVVVINSVLKINKFSTKKILNKLFKTFYEKRVPKSNKNCTKFQKLLVLKKLLCK